MTPEAKQRFELYKEKSFPIGFNTQKCEEIKKHTTKITLTNFTDTQITDFRKKIEQANKKYDISKKNIQDKILEVMEVIYFLNSVTPEEKLLKPYIQFLQEYEYVIRKILENKRTKTQQIIVDQIMIVLRPEMEKFIGKFARIIEGDIDIRNNDDTEDIL